MNFLENQIFEENRQLTFEELALEVFKFQAENCSVYKEYLSILGRKNPTCVEEIPFLPIDFFKTHKILSQDGFSKTFKSSGTGGVRSNHYIHDLKLYEKSFFKTYEQQIGQPKNQVILALLPNYVEQGNSSLVYMVDSLIRASENTASGFLLNSPEEIITRYQAAIDSGKQVVLFGVSYALLDLAEFKPNLSKATIIETGGMKGRRKEISKEELHETLSNAFNCNVISSEYGMTELLSQSYSKANGFFTENDLLRIYIRQTNDPFNYVQDGKTGGINVIDLANLNSCSFIATQDLGKKTKEGFKIMGRFDNSDIRGCNLMVQ